MCDCTSSPSSLTHLHPISLHTTSSFPSSLHFPTKNPSKHHIKATHNPNPSKPNQPKLPTELHFQETQTTNPKLEFNLNSDKDSTFIEFDGILTENQEDELVKDGETEDGLDELGGLEVDGGGKNNNEVGVVRRGKQLMKRSNVVAKQVISIESAVSLGFVSQLWVDTNTWMVVIVEVRPNLLSGNQEMFFLQDTRQVGDVVLVEDETVMDKEFKMVGLETLVGYNVVTPGRRDIGKVRGYTFNINSGAIESLELDSFGISIIPSSLVSTYALLVEDVLEVLSDTVVVHEAAASRIQRLTKGFWDARRTNYSMDDLDYYSDLEDRSEYRKDRRGRRPGSGNRRPREKPIDNTQEDWDLPMDYL